MTSKGKVNKPIYISKLTSPHKIPNYETKKLYIQTYIYIYKLPRTPRSSTQKVSLQSPDHLYRNKKLLGAPGRTRNKDARPASADHVTRPSSPSRHPALFVAFRSWHAAWHEPLGRRGEAGFCRWDWKPKLESLKKLPKLEVPSQGNHPKKAGRQCLKLASD